MSTPARTSTRCIAVTLLLLGLQAPGAFAQPTPAATERLHANAVASFRQARFSEAYGRLIPLADAGHGPSAELALWMYQNGPSLFGKDWDSSPEQLTAWAEVAHQPAPVMVARVYPAQVQAAASRRKPQAQAQTHTHMHLQPPTPQ